MKKFEEFTYENGSIIEGLTKELSYRYIINYFDTQENSLLIVTSNLYDANKIQKSLQTYEENVFLFPMDDFLTSLALAVSPELKLKRLETLEKIQNNKCIVVTNMMGYLKLNTSLKEQNSLYQTLKTNTDVNRDSLVEIFEKLGYQRDSMVTSTGEYAVRGFVLDIFLVDEKHPIRIEFFGDTIESIRYFDENTQRTIEKIDEIVCKPVDEIITENTSSLLDYMPNSTVFYYDYPLIMTAYTKLLEEKKTYLEEQNLEDKKYFYSFEELLPTKELFINTVANEMQKKKVHSYKTTDIENFKGDFKKLKSFVDKNIALKKTIVFFLSTKEQIEEIKDLFNENVVLTNENELFLEKINIVQSKINKGFIWDNLVVISENDIEEIKEKITYKNNLHIGKKIRNLDAIAIGDYVVHRNHGIGIYAGVVTLTIGGLKKDYLQIEYFGNDKVYVPVEKISSIYKYSDKDGMKPQISKLNSTAWQRKKQALQKKIKDISGELIKLYAERNNIEGEAYKDFEEETIFASDFTYEPTKDQQFAIEDVLKDMDSKVPMDRLLCGDVGFGKTEVAFRAMFKAVCNNKQVMYLCPTTILSKQQYESALDRFKNFPVEIRLFNRFTSSKEANEIIEDLASGKIDIVFGTHRLLSDKIKPKKLGLLVIDEEQRFGVTHKEKIKNLKKDVNVLTLSATPIPRTLKMSLSGLRDLSIIDTPPVNRYPIQTYVIPESDMIVKDAIYKELGRDGQCFILYNRVETIEKAVEKIHDLVPEARIQYAHGRLNKIELDNIMSDFINHKFDILVSTTIIETGIDIPNANTLIIYDADCFGLSQLYQLRGRVGRSNKIAYAYLLYSKEKMLNDIAVKRLQAIRDFTELGSGYKIAMRDLSIRGAGDLLGSEQAGFVDTVGISLYMKMIEEEMRRLKGENVETDDESESLVKVETHISDQYVSDEEVKIEIHKMINEIDSYQKLEDVRKNLEDRFGKITKEMEIYMYEEWFEKLAERLKITKVIQNNLYVLLWLPEETSNKVKGDKLFLQAFNINQKFEIKYENNQIGIKLNIVNNEKHFLYYIVPLLQKIADDLSV